MKYRSDIDGLRAIAILLVLTYHARLPFFPSGFIGVDIFFVISGFLITSILHQSLIHQNFSFCDFYNSRLWRLQPVFISLLLASTLLSLLFFLPEDLIQFSRSARKTSLFISNFFFNQITAGYFVPDTHQLPLLHTWSLAIEWQCYLLLPLIMYVLYRFVPKYFIRVLIYSLTVTSLLLALYYSSHDPAQNYYQFSSRIFEFLIGSCIVLTPFLIINNKWLSNGLSLIALLVILYIAGLDHILLGYPNVYALIVCLATAVLLILGSSSQSHITALLKIKPLVFIGVLSYSLYIWHWIIFAFMNYEGTESTLLNIIFAFMITFVLAYLSWHYIEKPARQLKNIKFSYTVIILMIIPISLTHLISVIIKKNLGFPQRFNDELVTIYHELDNYNSARRPLCIGKYAEKAECRIGANNTDSKKGFLIGDSFSNHYWGFLDILGKDANTSILAQATSSCITLPGLILYNWWHFKDQVYQECKEQTKRYYQVVREQHYDYVIIGQDWANYLSDSIINALGDERSVELAKKRVSIALDQALQIITESGARPILITSTPVMPEKLHDCFFKHIKQHQSYHPEQCNFNNQLSLNEQWFANLFAVMMVKYPKLIIIDPRKLQCSDKICKADLNGIPIYRDAGHITDYASYQFGEMYLERYKNPLG